MGDLRAGTGESTVSEWLGALAQPEPNPGGGAAAAVLAGISAALIEMVAGYTTGEGWADREERMREHIAAAGAVRETAPELADQDAAASAAFSAAFRLPEGSVEQRRAIESAGIAAAESAAALGAVARGLVARLADLARDANPMLLADVGVAAAAAGACLRAAAINVAVDLRAAGASAAERGELFEALRALDAAAEQAATIVAEVRVGVQATS